MWTYRLRIARGITSLVVLLLLAACGGGGGDMGEKGGPSSGAAPAEGIAAGGALRGGVLPAGIPGGGIPVGDVQGARTTRGADPENAAASDAAPRPPLPPHVPDEIIVKFRDGVPELNKIAARSRVAGTRLRAFRILQGLEHLRLQGGVSVAEAIERYRKDPDVLYAEPNYIVRATVTPDDTRFGDL